MAVLEYQTRKCRIMLDADSIPSPNTSRAIIEVTKKSFSPSSLSIIDLNENLWVRIGSWNETRVKRKERRGEASNGLYANSNLIQLHKPAQKARNLCSN